MEPLPRRPQHAGLQVDVADEHAGGLARAQAAGVHELQQRTVTTRGGATPARRGEQAPDLVAAEHLRKPPAGARTAQVGGRVAVHDLLAPQVAVERAQAGGLALQRGGRGG